MPDPRPAALDHIGATLRVLRYSAASGFADFATIYTWRTWTVGWLARVLCQVAFSALIGRLLGSAEQGRYLLVGNAVAIAAVEAMFVVASTTWERRAGTLPLLIAAPTDPALVFAGRSVQWLASGTATAVISLCGLGLIFGVPLRPAAVLAAVPLVALVALGTYCVGLLLAAVVLRVMQLRNVVGNVGHLVMLTICGVQVPVAFWPDWTRGLAGTLPLTHGLAAVRGALAGAGAPEVLRQAGLEVALAAGWLALAVLAFRRLAEHGRHDGSIEFGD
jgi:ABC-2 type transport system permease protein